MYDWPVGPRRCAIAAQLLFGAVATASAQRTAPSLGGTIVGYVTAKSTNEPLAFADVTVEQLRISTFAGSDGAFLIRGVPPGPTTVRVRRLGFAPAVVNVSVVADRTDTVRVALAPIGLELASVRITDAVCPRRPTTGADTATLVILGQIRLNAERTQLLAHEFPFVSSMERTIADEQRSESSRNARRRVVRVDTTPVAGEHEWRYAPGNLVVRNDDASSGAKEKMIVPQLIDFAGDTFVDAHCFRYIGLVSIDGERRIRVDFEPTKAIREPDLRGSMYLDTASYQIVRTTLLMEHPSPLAPATEMWDVRVDTWFREILPALPVIDRVCMRTTARQVTVGGERAIAGRAAVEQQRLIAFRFERGGPGDVPPVTPTPKSECGGDR